MIPLLKPCTWAHTSTVSRVNPSQTLYLGLHVHSLHGDTPSKTLKLGSHIRSLQGEDLQIVHGVHISKVSFVNPLQTMHLNSQVHSLQDDIPSRPCTCGHPSTVSIVTPPATTCIWGYMFIAHYGQFSPDLYIGSHIHILEVTQSP